MSKILNFIGSYKLLAGALVVLVVSIALYLAGFSVYANWLIAGFSIIVAIKMSIGMINDIRNGIWGVDILAITAIIATIAVGEYWATIVIVLMMSGGEALEDFANRRAQQELTALLERAPTMAHRVEDDGYVDVKIDEVSIDDMLMVLPGEVIPVDAVVIEGSSLVDESSLTGESEPVEHGPDSEVSSGTVNGESPLKIKTLRTAENSQYAQIVELVKSASDSRAPFVRLADRYAVPFTIIAYTIAGIAWYTSGDAVRFAEVLVVATPCPLLLGAPIAMISGMSRSAKHGIIVKSGAVIEKLARIKSAAFDKTGTLTENQLRVDEIMTADGISEIDLLTLAATAQKLSAHNTAKAIARAVSEQKLQVGELSDFEELPGKGTLGKINGQPVICGRHSFLVEKGVDEQSIPDVKHTALHIARDAHYAGTITFSDTVRENSKTVLAKLKQLGITKHVMITGDNPGTAEKVASEVGIDEFNARSMPKDKVEIVGNLQPRPVMMVGDGVNDAPVLAASDVGVAMGARGATAASESADVVIMLDDIGKVSDAVYISKRTIKIALQSIYIGIAISVILMIIAAFGMIPAIIGAALQEVVDVVVIFNALRAHGSWHGKDVLKY